MTWQSAVERTVTGLGYDLVGTEKGAGGLLRVYIEHEPQAGAERWITVDDCERVTRQLQHVLEVENCDYARLEVSSPGLDRPLRRAADFARFAGEQVEIALKLPFQGRKKWRGALRARPEGGESAWRLVLADETAAARKPGKARPKPPASPEVERVLDFSLDEVREAHLVPVVNFKGRQSAAPAEEAAATHDEDEGGRIQ
ncbi:MAG: ribosome maturation factor RimP [Proteobacteria bacterium]|nr:ribosome maturation factor RimP [Pseudomonadota bacterium]